MKSVVYLSTLPALFFHGLVYANCADENPQGPDAVIACAAKESGFASAKEFWEKKLFSLITLDGYCKQAEQPANLTAAQAELFTRSCAQEKGVYFDYDKFIAADAAMKAALGERYNFMRNGSYAVNTAELSNFLATASQETTGNGILPDKYQQDGLYYRSEYGTLGSSNCYTYPANPNWRGAGQEPGTNCAITPFTAYLTNYYPYSTYVVAVKPGDTHSVYTKFAMDNDAQYNLNPQITVSFPGLPNLLPSGTYAAPQGTQWQYMNQTIDPGYWSGQGNLQLTGFPLTQFFGWYNQVLAPNAPIDFANFNDFVTRYVGDGMLAWEGGLWYWNVRIRGFNQPTLHTQLTGSKEACHDIGLTTYLINGGCNNANERILYYKYYKSNVFKQSSAGVPYTYEGVTSNSMECSETLANYCAAALDANRLL